MIKIFSYHRGTEGWLVGCLAFNATFSTNRLSHDMVVFNMSFRGRVEDKQKINVTHTVFNLVFVEITLLTRKRSRLVFLANHLASDWLIRGMNCSH